MGFTSPSKIQGGSPGIRCRSRNAVSGQLSSIGLWEKVTPKKKGKGWDSHCKRAKTLSLGGGCRGDADKRISVWGGELREKGGAARSREKWHEEGTALLKMAQNKTEEKGPKVSMGTWER